MRFLASVTPFEWIKFSLAAVGLTATIALLIHQVGETTNLASQNATRIAAIESQASLNTANISQVSKSLEKTVRALDEIISSMTQHNIKAEGYIRDIQDNKFEIQHLRDLEDRRHQKDVDR